MGERVRGLGTLESRNSGTSILNRYRLTILPRPGTAMPKLSDVEALLLRFKREAADINIEVMIDRLPPEAASEMK